MLDAVWNFVFSPLLGLHPAITILSIGAILITVTTLINKKFLGTGRALEVKNQMQEIREKMLHAQKNGDTENMNKHMSEMMKINSEYFMHSFKPLIISMFLVILILPWLKATYTGMTIATLPSVFPYVGGFELSWFYWYMICSFSLSMIIRKIIGV